MTEFDEVSGEPPNSEKEGLIRQSAVEALRDWALNEPLIFELYAIGSRVGGTASEESDLDVAVTLDLPYHKLHANWLKHEMPWARDLTNRTGYSVHLLALNEDIAPPDWDSDRFARCPKLLVYRKKK